MLLVTCVQLCYNQPKALLSAVEKTIARHSIDKHFAPVQGLAYGLSYVPLHAHVLHSMYVNTRLISANERICTPLTTYRICIHYDLPMK